MFLYWQQHAQDFLEHLRDFRKLSESTITAYGKDIECLGLFLVAALPPHSDWSDVTPDLLEKFVRQLKDKNSSDTSLYRRVTSVRAFFRWLLVNGQVRIDPSKGLKVPRKSNGRQPIILSEAQIEQMFRFLSRAATPRAFRDYVILRLLYETGIRTAEALSLRLSDVNLQARSLRYVTPRGKHRELPISEDLSGAMSHYLCEIRPRLTESRDDVELVFIGPGASRIPRHAIWQLVRYVGSITGVSDEMTVSVLRNSRIAHLLNQGLDARLVQEWFGHAYVRTTLNYHNLSTSQRS